MGTQETVVNQRPIELAPVDTNVAIPKSVRDAAARAEALHAAAHADPSAAAQAQSAAEGQAAPQQADLQQAQQNVSNEPQVQAPAATLDLQAQPQQVQPQAQQVQPQSAGGDEGDWHHRYLSMKGRWEASQRQVGQLQETCNQLAAELQNTQMLLERAGVQRAPAANAPAAQGEHKKLITDQDRETYGDELIDVARRAALETVSPELEALRAENQDLKRRVISTSQRDIYTALGRAVPNWRQVNVMPEFKAWLRLPNIYTQQVRQNMLDAAFQAADAPRVVAIFKDFVTEVVATGGQLPQVPAQQQSQSAPEPASAPPAPALSMEAIAAPGRARPAGGDTQQPADKPTYTRAQISGFYRDVRRGVYSGREAEKDKLERDIIAAQNEGRVRG